MTTENTRQPAPGAIPNLPDGWTQRPGDGYAKVPLSFAEGQRVYAEPSDDADEAPIEFGGEGYTVAEAEELIQRLTEAVAICKAGQPGAPA